MTVIKLPDLIGDWPWPRVLNPHYDLCLKESLTRMKQFVGLSPEEQRILASGKFELLAGLAYHKLNKEGLRIGCDLMNFFFIFDYMTDIADAQDARKLADIVMDAIRHPHKERPQGEWVGGEVARRLWQNAITTATLGAQKRFVYEFQLYVDACVEQSIDRQKGQIRTLETYFPLRRATIGAYPSNVINEIHLNLPDFVLEDPVIKALTECSCDLIIVQNDVYSYNAEQADGNADHNIITVLVEQKGMELQQAFDWVGKLFESLASRFLADLNRVPSWGQRVDSEVAIYTDAMGNWIRANYHWCFENERYFGKDGARVERERTMTLFPKSQDEN